MPVQRRSCVPPVLALASSLLLGACGPDLPPAPRPAPGTSLEPGVARRIDEALAAVGERPGDLEARLELAMVYDANAFWDLAAATYAQVAEAAPERPRAWAHLGRMQAELGALEPALAALDRALALAPDHPPLHWRRGFLLLELHRLAEAEQAFRSALEADPADPTGVLGLARVALQRDDPAAAAALLEPLARLRPQDGAVQALHGRALAMTGQQQAAEAAWARSEGPTGAYADPWVDEALRQVAGYNGDVRRARELLEGGAPREALAILRPILAAHPDDVTVHGMILSALVQEGALGEALELLEEGSASLPEHFRLELNWGLVLELAGRLEDALAHLERATELHPRHGLARAELADVQLALGRPAQALASYRAALALGHDGPAVQLGLGRALSGVGDWRAAATTLRELLERAPDLPQAPLAWGELARAQAERGRTAEAERALRELERRAPGHPLSVEVRARLRALAREAEAPERAAGNGGDEKDGGNAGGGA